MLGAMVHCTQHPEWCGLRLEEIAVMCILTGGCSSADLERAVTFHISPPGIVINSVHTVSRQAASLLSRMINMPETKDFVEQETGTYIIHREWAFPK